jgi:hypothetical protein
MSRAHTTTQATKQGAAGRAYFSAPRTVSAPLLFAGETTMTKKTQAPPSKRADYGAPFKAEVIDGVEVVKVGGYTYFNALLGEGWSEIESDERNLMEAFAEQLTEYGLKLCAVQSADGYLLRVLPGHRDPAEIVNDATPDKWEDA